MAEGTEVFGLVRATNRRAPDGVQLLDGNLGDESSLDAALHQANPDEVYNLAAMTFVPDSWANKGEAQDVNAKGVVRLAQAMKRHGSGARLCHASTAEIFGAPDGLPQGEDHETAPVTPYGHAKLEAHRFVADLRDQRGLFACSAILFNHESPRRPPSFVTRKITMGVARIARGLDDLLALGNLDAGRDWGYAPEYMDAMRLMMRAPSPRDYVVATGRSATVRDFVRLAFAHVDLDWEKHVRCDAGLLRQGDAPARIGDPTRIARDLGWSATTSLEQLIALMVDADLALLDA